MIGKSIFLVMAATVAMVGPVQAQTQPQTQTQTSLWGQPVEPIAAEAIRNFAICAVRQTPDGAERLLAMDFRDASYGDAIGRYAQGHSYCGRGELRANSVLFAGGLAEALLRRGNMVDNLPTLLQPVVGRAALPARDETEYVGLCVALRAPGEVRTMLSSDPGSVAERAALGAFSDDLSACVQQGQTMRMNRPGLRALVALAAYRLARHNAAPAMAPGN